MAVSAWRVIAQPLYIKGEHWSTACRVGGLMQSGKGLDWSLITGRGGGYKTGG